MSLPYNDQYYYGPDNFRTLETTRRKRCRSCGVLIDIGSRCLEFTRARGLAPQYVCGPCGEIYFKLDKLGWQLCLGDDWREDHDGEHKK